MSEMWDEQTARKIKEFWMNKYEWRPLKEHTTHFDDCSCLSHKYQEEISRLTSEIEGLKKEREAFRGVAIDNAFLGVAEPYRLGNEHLKKLRIKFGEEVDKQAQRILKSQKGTHEKDHS